MVKRKKPHELGSRTVVSADVAFGYKAPATQEEWDAQAKIKKIDANDLAFQLGPKGMAKWLDQVPVVCTHNSENRIVSMRRMMACYPTMREPVIEGLLRRGEIMNVIAESKAGKSFLSGNLALSFISGSEFLGRFKCASGRVLIVDNELHPETLTDRYRRMANSLHVSVDRLGRMVDILPLRGCASTLESLSEDLASLRSRSYIGLIVDPIYKLYPDRFDENSNADMAKFYSVLESFADSIDCSLIVVHHTSKGNNSGKAVTDVGAGAGVISRACDAHLVLRRQEEDGVFVVDAANRSFAKIEPFCARFKFPVWSEAKGCDPNRLLGMKENFGSRTVGGVSEDQGEDIKIETLLKRLKPVFNVRDVFGYGKDLNIKPFDEKKICRSIIPKWIGSGRVARKTKKIGSQGATYEKIGYELGLDKKDATGVSGAQSGTPETQKDSSIDNQDVYNDESCEYNDEPPI